MKIEKYAKRIKTFYAVQEGKLKMHKKQFTVNADEVTWNKLLRLVGQELEIEEVEGLYNEEGIKYWRIMAIPSDGIIYARLSENLSQERSLLADVRDDVQYLLMPNYASVAESRDARIELERAGAKETLDGLVMDNAVVLDPVPMSDGRVESVMRIEAMHNDSVKKIVQQLEVDKTNRDVQRIGIRFLCQRTDAKTNAILLAVLDGKGAEAAMDMMHEFPKDEDLGYYACWLLGNLMPVIAGSHDDLEMMVVKCIAHTLVEMPERRLAKYGLLAINYALEKHGILAKCHNELEILPALFACMENCPEEIKIHVYCMWVIHKLVSSGVANFTVNDTTTIVRHAKKSNARFYYDDKLQRAALFLIERFRETRFKLPEKAEAECLREGAAIGALY